MAAVVPTVQADDCFINSRLFIFVGAPAGLGQPDVGDVQDEACVADELRPSFAP